MAGYLDIKKKYNEQIERMKTIPNYDKQSLDLFGKLVSINYKSKSNKYYNEELAAYYLDWNIANPKFNNMHERVLELMRTEDVEDYILTVSKLSMASEDWESPAAILFLKDKVTIITCRINEEDANSVLGYFKTPEICEMSLTYNEVQSLMKNINLYNKHILSWPVTFEGCSSKHNIFVHASYVYVRNLMSKKIGLTTDVEVNVVQEKNKTSKSVKEYVNRRQYCFLCGASLVQGAKFCGKCGRKVK